MGKNLGGAILDLLESERVDLRAAAATVLAAVGKGNPDVEAALAARLADPDDGVRRIALEGLAAMGATGIAGHLVPLLRGGDDGLAERAAEVLAQQGGAAEAALRKEIGAGPVGARRVIAQLLLRRGTQPAIEAVVDQLPDHELGEQALQLLRHELDQGNERLADLIEKIAAARATDAGKALGKAWAKAQQAATAAAQLVKAARPSRKPTTGNAGAKPAKRRASGAAMVSNGAAVAPAAAPPPPLDPLREPTVAAPAAELAGLLRLLGYLARPSIQPLLLKYADVDQPRPVRLAAIAGLRRIVAAGEARGAEKVIGALIELADGDDAAVAQAAVDTLQGARIPEALARPFAALAKSRHPFAQKLAMERLPAGGGSSAVKALVEALGGEDPTARDAAARGLAKAPEAVLPLTRALLAATDEQIARRYAGALRSHRGHVPPPAIDELTAAVHAAMEQSAKGKASADEIVLERVLAELLSDLAPARHVELLFERARRLRKAKKAVEAFGSIKPLLRTRADLDAAIDDEQRYFLAALAVENAGEGLLRTARPDDPIFDQLSRLAAKGVPVARRLSREKDISDETIYALGFRLIESGEGAHEDLGAELLEGIIEERPRSKLAKAARNKLRLTGHLDE